MIKQKLRVAVVIAATLMLSGCYSNANSVLDNNSKQSQLQLRTYQSRAFDTADKTKTMRTVIATLQDLDFVIDKADATLGTVTGTKFTYNTPLLITVSIRPRGERQLIVRANAQYGIQAVQEPIAYQDFFNSLSKAMFLDAHEVS
ncbi:MAG TPA: hypothetical protein VLG38_03460 [Gammaproteobacteria bacterium]|nr:hypothetical protein [Gammaproteobacteria bacterium]